MRISPDELHVDEPEFIDVLYPAGGVVRGKCGYFTRILGYGQLHDFYVIANGSSPTDVCDTDFQSVSTDRVLQECVWYNRPLPS